MRKGLFLEGGIGNFRQKEALLIITTNRANEVFRLYALYRYSTDTKKGDIKGTFTI
jgi:hypothetical protein